MKEKDIQQIFSRVNKIRGLMELKLVKGKRYKFSQLAPHQKLALLDCNSDVGCSHKLSDFSMGEKPVDYFMLKNYPAYVCICFYEPRKTKMMYYVPIAEYCAYEGTTGMKSMTEVEVSSIARFEVDYKGL